MSTRQIGKDGNVYLRAGDNKHQAGSVSRAAIAGPNEAPRAVSLSQAGGEASPEQREGRRNGWGDHQRRLSFPVTNAAASQAKKDLAAIAYDNFYDRLDRNYEDLVWVNDQTGEEKVVEREMLNDTWLNGRIDYATAIDTYPSAIVMRLESGDSLVLRRRDKPAFESRLCDACGESYSYDVDDDDWMVDELCRGCAQAHPDNQDWNSDSWL